MQIYSSSYIKLFGLILSIDLPQESFDLQTNVRQAGKILKCLSTG